MVAGNGAAGPDEGARLIRASAGALRKKLITHAYEYKGARVTLALPHQGDFARALRAASLRHAADITHRIGGTLARPDATEEERQAALAEIAAWVETYGDVPAAQAQVMVEYVLEVRDPVAAPDGEPTVTLGWVEAIGVPLADCNTATVVAATPAFTRELLAASAEFANWTLARLTSAAAFMAARREAELKNSKPPLPGGQAAADANDARS